MHRECELRPTANRPRAITFLELMSLGRSLFLLSFCGVARGATLAYNWDFTGVLSGTSTIYSDTVASASGQLKDDAVSQELANSRADGARLRGAYIIVVERYGALCNRAVLALSRFAHTARLSLSPTSHSRVPLQGGSIYQM